jgi:hypothetical protein
MSDEIGLNADSIMNEHSAYLDSKLLKGYTVDNVSHVVSEYIKDYGACEPQHREPFVWYADGYFENTPVAIPASLLPDNYSWHYYDDGTRRLLDPDNKMLYVSDIFSSTQFEFRFCDGHSGVYEHGGKLPAREDIEQAVIYRGIVKLQDVRDNMSSPSEYEAAISLARANNKNDVPKDISLCDRVPAAR